MRVGRQSGAKGHMERETVVIQEIKGCSTFSPTYKLRVKNDSGLKRQISLMISGSICLARWLGGVMSVRMIHGRQSDEAASLRLIRVQLKPGVKDSIPQSEEQGDEA